MRRWLIALTIMAAMPLLAAGRLTAAADNDDEKKPEAPKPKVVVFRLHGQISEAPGEDAFPFGRSKLSFRELMARFKRASEDSTVKAIVLVSEGSGLGAAQREEMRQAMAKVCSAGKDIYVHSDSLAMGDYVLFSGASRLSLVPTADLWVTGLFGEAPYLRGLLDKLGVKPDFLTCGAYKSASEIFMREGPSPEAEKMQNWLLDSLYATSIRLIAEGRHVDVAHVTSWIDNGPYSAEKAKAAGLIDAVETREDFTTGLKTKFGKDVVFVHKYGDKKGPELDLSSPFAVLKVWGDLLSDAKKKKSGKDAVAVVYVEGAISLGGSEPSPFGNEGARSTDIRKALDEAARDDSVKAVVLRVDSPGGSAVASEIILAATQRVKAKKKYVVSMGNVAGSGGYYVSCAADTVFADAATITGSIGVVAGKFATNDMWRKVGVSFKAYQRGANAGILASDHTFTPEERQRMQTWMNDVYAVFKKHVTDIRGSRLKKPIDDLAGGRVYTGQQALELGLVDKIGTLQDAIAYVAGQAKLTDYDVRVIPRPKNFIEQIMEEASGGKDNPHEIESAVPRTPAAAAIPLWDLAAPYLKGLDPERLASVKLALGRLQLIRQEGAVLMMPEFTVRP